MLIGYARVSTDDQNLDLQHDALKNVGCEKFYDDLMTGSKMSRPGLEAAIDFARQGDIIVVWRLDRLSRSLKDLIEIVAILDEKRIGLKSLHESIDTSSSSGKLIFHIFGALAEFERNLIRERTHAGLQAARARGRKGGRPKKLSDDKAKIALKLYRERQHSIQQICNIVDVSKPTLYKYINNTHKIERNEITDKTRD